MRKIYFLFLIVCSLLSLTMEAQPTVLGSSIVNGTYTTTTLATVGGFKQLRVQATSAAAASARNWEFATGTGAAPVYTTNWRPYTSGNVMSLNTFIPVGFANGARYNTSSGGASGELPAITANNYYTFNVSNNGAADNVMQLLETTYNPETISTVSRLPVAVGPTTSPVITVVTSVAPQANVFIRYSTDNFVTSVILPVSFTGTTGTASIPAQTVGTVVRYYVYNSNKTKAQIDADVVSYGEGVHDMSTLNLNNNAGANYTYTVTANVVTVNATNAGNDASYASLGAAFTAINGGVHTGVVAITITGNTAETVTASLSASGTGSASYSAVSIQPTGGAARTITGTLSAAIIDLNGADNVTIDGLNTGGNALNISNAGTGIVLQLSNSAQNNTISKATISGATASTSTGMINFTTAGSGTGNNNNVIENCTINGTGASNTCINSVGSAIPNENKNNIVRNCTIFDFFNATGATNGVNLGSGNSTWTIGSTGNGNSFYQTANRTITATMIAINIQPAAANGTGGHTINSNFIGGTAANCGGTALTFPAGSSSNFIGIALSVATTNTTTIQGNTIRNINLTSSSTSTSQNAMRLISGAFNCTQNTIGGTAGSITVSLSGSAALFSAISAGTGTVSDVNISSNTISGITFSGTAATVPSIRGISFQGSGTSYNINNNTIFGCTSASNSLLIAIFAFPSGTSASQNVNNNTIFDLVSTSTGTAAQVQGINLAGAAGVGSYTCQGNTIRNLSAASTSTSTSTTPAVIGIVTANTSSVPGHIVTQNLIRNLASTNTGTGSYTVTGISVTAPATGTTLITRNTIQSFSLAATGTASFGTMRGINITSGNPVIQNNMIRLGIDSTGTNITTGYDIIGINEFGGNATYLNNTVYIGGGALTGAGAGSSTYALLSSASGTTRDIRNNILVNQRSRGTQTAGSHYAVGVGTNTGSLTIGGNIYGTNAGTNAFIARHNSADHANLQSFRASLANGLDLTSTSTTNMADINFVNATGSTTIAANTADLRVTGTTAADGAGITIASVTDDIDGNTRTAPYDIGASQASNTPLDIFRPYFTISSPLTNTASVVNRTITITVNDVGTGVPTSGTLQPRIYFRRSAPAATPWASTQGAFQSGTGNTGTWQFTVDYTALSVTPVVGETYQYYFVAQDQATPANNLWFSSFDATTPVFTDVNTNTTPVATAISPSYNIVAGLPTTINVPGDYPAITTAGGLFAAINGAALTGNTTVNITGNTVEDGANALLNAGLAGFTLTIQPSSATNYVIASTVATASTPMININGAKNVTFDGSFAGSGQFLTFRNTNTTNTSTSAVVQFTGGATGALRNSIVESNAANTTSRGTVYLGGGSGTTTVTIDGNDIRDATAGTAGAQAIGIYMVGGGGLTQATITNNRIYNFINSGIWADVNSLADGNIITGNSFYHTPTAPVAATSAGTFNGIRITSGNGHNISGNFIGGQAPNAGGSAYANNASVTFTGISLTGGSNAGTPNSVQGNTIQNIVLSGSATFTGLLVNAGNANIGTVTGNTIGHAATANSIQITAGTNSHIGISLTGGNNINIGSATASNTIANLSYNPATAASGRLIGINNNGAASGAVSIINNSINNLRANTSATGTAPTSYGLAGIATSIANVNQLMELNTITALRNLNTAASGITVAGITTGSTSSGGAIRRNRIFDLTNVATGGAGVFPQIFGIDIYDGSAATGWTVSNNQVSLTNGANTNELNIYGINNQATAPSTFNCFYNSVYIGGNTTGTTLLTTAFSRGFSAITFSIRNNIFYNGRTAAGAVNYSLYNNDATWSPAIANYNLFVSPSAATMALVNGVAQTFAAWKVATGGDVNSVSDVSTNLTPSALFVNTATGNLNINTDAGCIVDGKGTPITGITIDYSNDPRNPTTPDIGSDEFTGNFVLTITNPPAACATTPVDLTLAAVTAGSSTGAALTYWTDAGATNALATPSAVTAGGTYYIRSVKGSCSDIKPVTVTFIPAATANAGGNQAICAGNTFTVVGATATNNAGVNWTTGGDGTFINGTTLTPTYTPGVADILAGTVTLTLTATGNSPCGNVTNNMTLTITNTGLLAATAGGPQVCQTKTIGIGATFNDNSCNTIATVVPAALGGGTPVTGSVTGCVKIESSIPQYGVNYYVARHYDIEPATAPATSSAYVTLYFSPAEMAAFNSDPGAIATHFPLPVNPGDNTDSIRIEQYHGTGTDPTNYTGALEVWSTANGLTVTYSNGYWAITIPATSFSGFWLTAKVRNPLPVNVEYFRGSKQGDQHKLDWKVTCTNTQYATLTIEAGTDGRNFSSIYSTRETALRCQQAFTYTNTRPLPGINYYRLKMTDDNGVVTYSSIVALTNATKGFEVINITPNPVTEGKFKLNITSAEQVRMEVVITDLTGRVVAKQNNTLIAGFNAIDVNVGNLANGTYQVTGITAAGRTKVLSFVKQ